MDEIAMVNSILILKNSPIYLAMNISKNSKRSPGQRFVLFLSGGEFKRKYLKNNDAECIIHKISEKEWWFEVKDETISQINKEGRVVGPISLKRAIVSKMTCYSTNLLPKTPPVSPPQSLIWNNTNKFKQPSSVDEEENEKFSVIGESIDLVETSFESEGVCSLETFFDHTPILASTFDYSIKQFKKWNEERKKKINLANDIPLESNEIKELKMIEKRSGIDC
jgi:hypothetical protein